MVPPCRRRSPSRARWPARGPPRRRRRCGGRRGTTQRAACRTRGRSLASRTSGSCAAPSRGRRGRGTARTIPDARRRSRPRARTERSAPAPRRARRRTGSEVGAHRGRQPAQVGVGDHRVDVLGEQRLAPVVELDLEHVRPDLVEQPAVELERHVRARAARLADAGEARRAAQVADVGRLERQLDRIRPQARAAEVVLEPRQGEIGPPAEGMPRAPPRRPLEEQLRHAVERDEVILFFTYPSTVPRGVPHRRTVASHRRTVNGHFRSV